MLNMADIYDELRRRTASNATFIVIISSSPTAGPWFLSDHAIQLVMGFNDITTLELIDTVGPISENMNIITREWGIAQVKITIHNKPVFKSSGAADEGMLLRPSDVFGQLHNRSISIRIYPDAAIVNFFYCLSVFKGRITEMPEVDGNTMVITATAESTALSVRLPNEFITDDMISDIPTDKDALKRVMPIVYGQYSETDYMNGRGLVPAVQLNAFTWIIAAHAVNSIGDIWLFCEALDSWGIFRTSANITKNINKQGYAIVKIYGVPPGYTFIYPDDGISGGTESTDDLAPETVDKDETTYGELRSGVYSDDYNENVPSKMASLTFNWTRSFDPDRSGRHAIIGRIVSQAVGAADADKIALEVLFEIETGFTNTYQPELGDGAIFSHSGGYAYMDNGIGQLLTASPWKRYYMSREELIHTGANPPASTYSFNWTNETDGIHWHLGSGGGETHLVPAAEGFPIRIILALLVDQSPSYGTVVGRIKEIRLRIPFGPLGWRGLRNYQKTPRRRRRTFGSRIETSQFDVIAAAVQGGTYGSWIDAGGRSNPWNHMEIITHPAGIIESLLRDILGFSSSDIDTDSFDDCSTNMSGNDYNLALHYDKDVTEKDDRRPTAAQVIQQICRENECVFYQTVNRKARLIRLNDMPTSGIKILQTDMLEESVIISYSRLDQIVNRATIECDFRLHDNRYLTTINYGDTNSQSQYGILDKTIIVDGHAENFVTNNLAKWWFTTNLPQAKGKFLSEPKLIVTFTTVGIKYAHLEIGDWIEFEHEKMDLVMKLAGQSWQGRTFLIVGKEVTIAQTKFMVIEPLARRG